MSFIPFGTKDTASYSKNSGGQRRVFSTIVPNVMKCLETIIPSPGQPFTIGDYGTADGGVSYQLIHDCIEFLRSKYGDDLPIQVIYEDQPINDFRPVFDRAQGILDGVEGLTKKFKNVYVLASGCSFYTQCVPDESIDLIISTNSTHWLSNRPDVLCDSLFLTDATQSDKNSVKKQAEKDWGNFLYLRGKELRRGGKLVVVHMCQLFKDENISRLSDSIWKSLYEDKITTQEEFKKMYLGLSPLSVLDLRKPFIDSKSYVKLVGLELTSWQSVPLSCPFQDEWNNQSMKSQQGNRTLFAKRLVAQHRGWQMGPLLSGLSKQRSETDKCKILKMFYERFLKKTIDDPTVAFGNMNTINCVIRKNTDI